MTKGEIQYKQRIGDIRLLKLEIKKLRREKTILMKNVSSLDELRKEVYHTQRELLKERTRCKALEEELENPMNIHRWRKLEASDPSQYEMILKIHALQKRLIMKTEEVVDKELQITEKEKLYSSQKYIKKTKNTLKIGSNIFLAYFLSRRTQKRAPTSTRPRNRRTSQFIPGSFAQ